MSIIILAINTLTNQVNFAVILLPPFLPPWYISGSKDGHTLVSRQANKSDQPDQYANFERALKKVLSVSPSEIKARIKAENARLAKLPPSRPKSKN
jgi:hypothetical protein